MKRRSALATGALVASGVGVGAVIAERGVTDVEPRQPTPSNAMLIDEGTLRTGTDRETKYFEIGAEADGPTAVVIGGIHGDEVNGYRAAERIVEWELNTGSIVVVPWADIVAVRRNEREGPDGDFNRLFPAGESPETPLARELWELLLAVDPDFVVDLHRSRGLYETHGRWVGQALFPTAAGDATADVDAVIERMNQEHVPRSMRFHRFQRGNTLGGERPLLVHKVGANLETAGVLVELTDFLLDLPTQVRWTERITELLLARYGIERVSQ